MLANIASENSSFSHSIPGLQIAYDSTSIGVLKECPKKYYYSVVLGWQSRELSIHLVFGIAYHSALERYYHARALGKDHAAGLRAAVRFCLETSWNTELSRPMVWPEDKNKNRYTLLRSVVWYLDQFENDPMETVILENGKPAVELSFRFQMDKVAPDGQHYIMCGHLDRLAKFNNQIYVNDHKTTKSPIESEDYFDRYSPDNQMSLYSFAAKVVYHLPVQGVIVNAAQVLVTLSRYRRGFATRTESQLDEWYSDTKHFISTAEAYARAQHWPMNDKSCGLYGGCPFRQVCGKSPEVREKWIAAGFKRRVWDPLQIRGDL